MTTRDCTTCKASGVCCTHGKESVDHLRNQIKKLTALLDVVSKCKKRRGWDSTSGKKNGK
jgi:phosphoribosyl-dephospho-CoA transferase